MLHMHARCILMVHDCKDENVYKSPVLKLSVFFIFSKNEYAETVRARQLIDDLVEAYIKVLHLQVF